MKKKVLIWVPLESSVGRDVCRGVYHYSRLHALDWEVMHSDPCLFPLDDVISWELDGLIGPLGHSDLAEQAKKAPFFCINMHGGTPFGKLPQSGVNDQAIGETAADYFLNLHFDHFGYYGIRGLRCSDDRWTGYSRRLAACGKKAVQFTASGFIFTPAAPKNIAAAIRPELKQWLIEQPRPCALFVQDDMRTNMIYTLCRETGLAIPDDIALLGVNDDDIYCYKNNPPLSSIQVPSRTAGYRAAQILDRLFKGGKLPKKPVFLNPGAITERASTAVLKLDDRQVVKALRFISENAVHAISTEEIARAAGLSRRVLEKRFRTLLNCSPQAEVHRAQIEKVKNALRETNLSLEEIAVASGFTSGNYLSQIFKKTTGQTPGSYRRSFR
jgi:LacI family transcriptional regulator